ncbi:MAG: hypothetical protein RL885_15440 [Planctomycetota bacterium]
MSFDNGARVRVRTRGRERKPDPGLIALVAMGGVFLLLLGVWLGGRRGAVSAIEDDAIASAPAHPPSASPGPAAGRTAQSSEQKPVPRDVLGASDEGTSTKRLAPAERLGERKPDQPESGGDERHAETEVPASTDSEEGKAEPRTTVSSLPFTAPLVLSPSHPVQSYLYKATTYFVLEARVESSSPEDFTLSIHTEDGQEIDGTDLDGYLDARELAVGLDGGRYLIRLSTDSDEPVGVKLHLAAHSQRRAEDPSRDLSWESASELGLSDSAPWITEVVGDLDDADVYRFRLEATGELGLHLASIEDQASLELFRVEVRDDEERLTKIELTEDQPAQGSRPHFFCTESLSAGRYLARVASGGSRPSTLYRFEVQRLDDVPTYHEAEKLQWENGRSAEGRVRLDGDSIFVMNRRGEKGYPLLGAQRTRVLRPLSELFMSRELEGELRAAIARAGWKDSALLRLACFLELNEMDAAREILAGSDLPTDDPFIRAWRHELRRQPRPNPQPPVAVVRGGSEDEPKNGLLSEEDRKWFEKKWLDRAKDIIDERVGSFGSVEEAMTWAETELHLEVAKSLAEEKGLDPEEVLEAWKDRGRVRTKTAPYSTGTYILPLPRPPGIRPEKDKNSWWRKERAKNLEWWLFAYYGEYGFAAKRLDPKTRPCRQCGGSGLRAKEGLKPRAREVHRPCETCDGVRYDRTATFR